MGFKVFEKPFCYDGIPTASRVALSSGPERMRKQHNSKVAKVTLSIIEIFKSFFGLILGSSSLLGALVLFTAFLVSFFFAIYQFNLWQVSLA